MGTIVKYHNDLNQLVFKGFTSADYNVFMAICSRVRDQNTRQVTLSFDELKKLAGIEKNYTIHGFSMRLKAMNSKLLKLDYTIILNEQGDEADFVFFPTFKRSERDQTLTVDINEHGAYLLNQLAKNFTAFELEQYVALDSKYAKTLYRLLKQFKSTGELRCKAQNFREVLDVPESYTNMRITQEIIKPAVNALKGYFPNLEYEVIRADRRGRPVVGYLFRFDAEKPIEHQVTLPEYQKDQQQGKKSKSRNSFNDFEQNDYDFDDLERALLSR